MGRRILSDEELSALADEFAAAHSTWAQQPPCERCGHPRIHHTLGGIHRGQIVEEIFVGCLFGAAKAVRKADPDCFCLCERYMPAASAPVRAKGAERSPARRVCGADLCG